MPAKKTAQNTENTELDFESALARLNTIADELENKNPSLEKALELYEEGSRLLKECTDKIKKAEAKITLISKDE